MEIRNSLIHCPKTLPPVKKRNSNEGAENNAADISLICRRGEKKKT
jgi:hypothetical protein